MRDGGCGVRRGVGAVGGGGADVGRGDTAATNWSGERRATKEDIATTKKDVIRK